MNTNQVNKPPARRSHRMMQGLHRYSRALRTQLLAVTRRNSTPFSEIQAIYALTNADLRIKARILRRQAFCLLALFVLALCFWCYRMALPHVTLDVVTLLVALLLLISALRAFYHAHLITNKDLSIGFWHWLRSGLFG